jgi:hypothetical protein
LVPPCVILVDLVLQSHEGGHRPKITRCILTLSTETRVKASEHKTTRLPSRSLPGGRWCYVRVGVERGFRAIMVWGRGGIYGGVSGYSKTLGSLVGNAGSKVTCDGREIAARLPF